MDVNVSVPVHLLRHSYYKRRYYEDIVGKYAADTTIRTNILLPALVTEVEPWDNLEVVHAGSVRPQSPR